MLSIVRNCYASKYIETLTLPSFYQNDYRKNLATVNAN